MRIVYHRYGSLVNFDNPVMRQIDICRRLLIPRSTVNYTLICFERRGYRLEALGRSYQRYAKMSEPMQQALLSPTLLQQWAPFSLADRIELIRRVWNVTMTAKTLSRFYHEHGVYYRAAKKVFELARFFGPAKDRERETFALLLVNAIVQRRPLVYVDETTFSRDTILRKSWAARATPNHHAMPGIRRSITVYGAIGTCLTTPVYHYVEGQSTNGDDFIDFLAMVAAKVRPGTGKPLLVMDQHPGHFRADVQEEATRHFVPFPQSSYSSPFNCIERVWCIAKRNYGRLAILEPGRININRHLELVKEAMSMVTPQQISAVYRANKDYIRSCLRGESNVNFHLPDRYN